MLLLLVLQIAAAAPAPATARTWMVERQSSHRWMHGRQRAEFTVPTDVQEWWRVVANDATDGQRTYQVQTPFSRLGPTVQFTVGASGAPTRAITIPASADTATEFPFPSGSARAAVSRARLTLFDGIGSGTLALPETKTWELPTTFVKGNPRQGVRWLDTLLLNAVLGEFNQSLTGLRSSEIVGDTVVEGRRLWIVRDSAKVRYSERWLEQQRTLDSASTITRKAEGIIRGRYLYDSEYRIARARWDTTVLRGSATYSYPGRKSFTTPAQFDRTRTLMTFDSLGFVQRGMQARANAAPFSILNRPRDVAEARLLDGDLAFRDSLFNAWNASRDPRARRDLQIKLQRWVSDGAFRARLPAAALAAGDTNTYLRGISGAVWSTRLTADKLRLVLPFMKDPDLLFAFGFDRDVFYENIAGGLINNPPSLIADTASWMCEPAACRMLADQWPSAKESRLKEVGLVANFVLDPKRWADTMEAHATKGGIGARAINLIRGIGATWPAAGKRPVPAVNASWEDWVNWMSGYNPNYVPPAGLISQTRSSLGNMRFESTHGYALQVQTLINGRNFVDEFRRNFESANDTTRLVFGTMLLSMGKLEFDVAQFQRMFSPAATQFDNTLAQRALGAAFKSSKRADTQLANELTDTLLAMVLDGKPPWRMMNTPTQRGSRLGRFAIGMEPVYLKSDELSDAIKDKWSKRTTLITDPKWRLAKEKYPAMVISVSGIDVAGPLARVRANWTYEAASGEAGGMTLFLMKTESRWYIVSISEWLA